VDEAKKLGIPVIGILDTNADPDELAYPIPGNDDAIRSVALLTRIIADAAAEGLIQRHQKPSEGEEAAEPLAEWERELLEAGQAESVPADVPATPADVEAAVDAAPVRENDADAQADADLTAQADETVVAEHAPETQEQVEAKIEATSTEDEKTPRGAENSDK